MEVKVKCERTLMLCQGCLSADRKLSCVSGQNKALFLKLREDFNQCMNVTKELLLCWECIALINKMKHFQVRIKTAQLRLAQFLHTLCNKEDLPQTLSHLLRTKHKKSYDYECSYIFEEEQKAQIFKQNNRLDQKQLLEPNNLTLVRNNSSPDQNIPSPEQKDIFDQKDFIKDIENETLLQEIKIENKDIKLEYDNDSLNDDADYYESELKHETNDDFTFDKPKKRIKSQKKSIKKYEQFVTITKTNSSFNKNFGQYYETVHGNEEEVEQVIDRARKSRNKKLPLMCKLCKLGYSTRLDLLRHKTFNHTELQFPTHCMACKYEVISQSHLQDHWKEYHSSMLRCTLCGAVSRRIGEIVKHLNRMHTKIFSCNSCSIECRSLREFSDHYKKVHEQVVCDYCNKSVSSKQKLEKHINKQHLPQHCTICNRDYSSYHVFETHLRGSHPELLDCLKKTDFDKELRYCVECDKQYPSVYKYKRHLKQSPRHTPIKKLRVPCPDCDKVFTRTTYKNNHYRLVHMNQSKHYCQLCNKYFATGYGVRTHMQYVHEKIAMPKNKICDLCGRGFSTNKILINHRRTHTGERPFKCQYCTASFAQEVAMKSHQKTQHKNIFMTS